MNTTTTKTQIISTAIADIQRLHKKLEEELVPLLHEDYPEITDGVLDNSTNLIILAHTLVAPQLRYAKDALAR